MTIGHEIDASLENPDPFKPAQNSGYSPALVRSYRLPPICGPPRKRQPTNKEGASHPELTSHFSQRRFPAPG